MQEDSLGFLVGGGEMGGRIRAFDWARTPLGPAASWSPALPRDAGFDSHLVKPIEPVVMERLLARLCQPVRA